MAQRSKLPLQIEGIIVEFVFSVIIALATFFVSMKKYGRNKGHVILLFSTSALAVITFEILAGMSFPILISDYSFLVYTMFVVSLAGIIYGTREMFRSGKTEEITSHSAISHAGLSILKWSVVIASVGGIFGLVSLDYLPIGTFMELPPPLLGQPVGYQVIAYCNPVKPHCFRNPVPFRIRKAS